MFQTGIVRGKKENLKTSVRGERWLNTSCLRLGESHILREIHPIKVMGGVMRVVSKSEAGSPPL